MLFIIVWGRVIIYWEYFQFGNFTYMKKHLKTFQFVNYTMTNIQNICLSKIVTFVPSYPICVYYRFLMQMQNAVSLKNWGCVSPIWFNNLITPTVLNKVSFFIKNGQQGFFIWSLSLSDREPGGKISCGKWIFEISDMFFLFSFYFLYWSILY